MLVNSRTAKKIVEERMRFKQPIEWKWPEMEIDQNHSSQIFLSVQAGDYYLEKTDFVQFLQQINQNNEQPEKSR